MKARRVTSAGAVRPATAVCAESEAARGDDADPRQLVGELGVAGRARLELVLELGAHRTIVHRRAVTVRHLGGESSKTLDMTITDATADALVSFRSGLYDAFSSWADALFELSDALVCAARSLSSVPARSLEPESPRSHGSLYKALQRGEIDEVALRELFVAHRPRTWPLVFAVDASTWARGDAECSPAHGWYYSASHHSAGLSDGLEDLRCEVLVRIAETRVFHPDAPERNGKTMGRPGRHGERVVLADPSAWTPGDATLELVDHRYGQITVGAWHNLHPKPHGRGHRKGKDLPPIVRASVIHAEVEHLPKATARGKKTLPRRWSGPAEPDLERSVIAYLRRFDIEHNFRLVKGTLACTTPARCTPEQADRWTLLVAAAYSELGLARGRFADLRLPWERPCDPARLTSHRVRRGLRQLRAILGTPALPPRSITPGRPKGTKRPPRTRYPAIKRAA